LLGGFTRHVWSEACELISEIYLLRISLFDIPQNSQIFTGAIFESIYENLTEADLIAIAEFMYSMASEQGVFLLSTDGLESDVALARDRVTSTLYGTLEEQCAAQEGLCRAMLVLEHTKKEHVIRQLQADVDTTKAKIAFLDKNVIRHVDLYSNLMMRGVDLEALVLRNRQEQNPL